MEEKYKQLIVAHPLFSALDAEELNVFSGLFTQKSYVMGENIVKMGDVVDAIYFIAEGKAEVQNPEPLAVLGVGESIGLNDTGFFSSSGLRTASVVALSDVRVLRLDLEHFRDFLRGNPHVNQHVLESASILLKMRFIKQIRPFLTLSFKFLYQLAEEITEIVVPADTVLFKQGEMGEACYLIESGRIRISVLDQNGASKTLAELQSPSLFGETALLLDTPRNAMAFVVEDAKLLVISKLLFIKMMEKETDAAKAITVLHQARSRPFQAKAVDVFHQKTADGEEIVTLRQTAKNNYFQLSYHGWYIWNLLDGTRNLNSIVRDFYKEFNILNARVVLDLLLDLQDAGFVEVEIKREAVSTDRFPFWLKFFLTTKKMMEAKYAFGNVDAWLEKTYNGFVWIFYTKMTQYLLILLSVVGFGVFIHHFHQAVHLLSISPIKWTLFLAASYSIWITVIPHELAHAYTTKAAGRRVNAFGVGWFWLGPMAFCDTSDMWVCPDKKARIAVDLGGVCFNFILGSVAAICLLFTHQPSIIIFLWFFALFNYLVVFANISPILELDGYYTLMDILEKSNLRESSVLMLASIFDKENPVISIWEVLKQQKAETVYWSICFIYIVIESLLTYFLMQHVFYSLLGKYSHPMIGVVLSLMVIVFSGLGILAQVREKMILRAQRK